VYLCNHILQIEAQMAESTEPEHAEQVAARRVVDKTGAHTSAVWDFFGYWCEDKKQTTPVCKLCKKSVPAKASNTKNLAIHLQNYHPLEHSQLKKSKTKKTLPASAGSKVPTPSSASTSQAQVVQPRIMAAFTSSQAYKTSSHRHKQITDSVMNFMVKSTQPFSLVEEASFQNMLHVLDPRYDLPGRNHFSQTELPLLYEAKRSQVSSELRSVKRFATTSDLWSSQNTIPYVSLTIHYIDSDWKLQSRCLGAQFIPEDHTGENIADAVEDMLDEWSLKIDQMVCITTDSGSNMIKAAEEKDWARLPCFGHRLHSAIGKSD
jgi:hypothetical protein